MGTPTWVSGVDRRRVLRWTDGGLDFRTDAGDEFDHPFDEHLDAADTPVSGRATDEHMDVMGPLDGLDGLDVPANTEQGAPR